MKYRLELATCAFLVLAFLAFSASADDEASSKTIADNLSAFEIEEGVYRIVHSLPWEANCLLVDMSESEFVLVDTPNENGATRLLVEWIRNEFGEVNLTVINTHYHADCLGGNQYLLSQGIPVYGSDLTAKFVAERGEEDKNGILEYFASHGNEEVCDAFRDITFTPPDNLFPLREGLRLSVGNKKIEAYYPGPGHTEDNIVVYIPSRELLYGGCLVKSSRSDNLGNTENADLARWPSSVRNVLIRYHRARVVVPGHGSHGDMSMLHHTLGLLSDHKE